MHGALEEVAGLPEQVLAHAGSPRSRVGQTLSRIIAALAADDGDAVEDDGADKGSNGGGGSSGTVARERARRLHRMVARQIICSKV